MGKFSTKPSAYLALGVGVMIIGFSAIFVSLADAPGAVTSFYRMAVAMVLLVLPFSSQIQKRKEPLPRRGVWIAVLAGFIFSLDLTLWSTGIVLSGATSPTLVANTAPLWVGLGAWLIFGERQKPLFWAGLALAMVGATIVLGQDLLRNFELGLGTFLGLLAALFYGIYQILTQRGRAYLSTLTYLSITTITSTIFLFVYTQIFNQPLTGYSTFTNLNFLALGVVVQVGAWLMITYAQGYIPATIVAPILLAQPVITAFLAGLLLGETLTSWHILGGIAVLVGVFLVHRSKTQQLGQGTPAEG